MTILPEAQSAYFAARPSEHELALRLDEAFDITFGSATTFEQHASSMTDSTSPSL